jgi:hypothetical protein
MSVIKLSSNLELILPNFYFKKILNLPNWQQEMHKGPQFFDISGCFYAITTQLLQL